MANNSKPDQRGEGGVYVECKLQCSSAPYVCHSHESRLSPAALHIMKVVPKLWQNKIMAVNPQ